MQFLAHVLEEDLPEFIKFAEREKIKTRPYREGYTHTQKGSILYMFVCRKNGAGRPTKKVDKKKIQALKNEGKTVKEICEILELKRATYYKYMNK